jgi:hypothetical protein
MLSLFAFTITVQTENNTDIKLTEDKYINSVYEQLNRDLGNFSKTSQQQREVFESDNPGNNFGYLIFYSIISAGKVFTGMTIGLFNLLINLPVRYLGISPVIVSIFSTILIITVIIGLWIIYKVGG